MSTEPELLHLVLSVDPNISAYDLALALAIMTRGYTAAHNSVPAITRMSIATQGALEGKLMEAIKLGHINFQDHHQGERGVSWGDIIRSHHRKEGEQP